MSVFQMWSAKGLIKTYSFPGNPTSLGDQVSLETSSSNQGPTFLSVLSSFESLQELVLTHNGMYGEVALQLVEAGLKMTWKFQRKRKMFAGNDDDMKPFSCASMSIHEKWTADG